MNQIVIITSRVVITWLLLGITNAKIDFQQGSSTSSSQYFNEQPAVHPRAQQQLDDYYNTRRPNDKTTAADLSWVDYKRSYARPYSFNYVVNDDVYDNYYGHQQASDGSVTTGSYRVLLPDGRTQIVDFTADRHNGYVANVKYYEQKLASNYKKPSTIKSSPNYKNNNKKPWTAFNNKNNHKNQLTSYKANLIAAFGLKINNNQMTSSKTNVEVNEQPAIEYATIKHDEDANRSWTDLNKETSIHEAKAVYHQQNHSQQNYYETSSISTPIINKKTTLSTPINYRANYQPINQSTTTNRNGYDYVAPTTYRPVIPYYYNIPSSSSSTTRQPPAWTWLTTNYGSITTTSAPVNYKKPTADYLNYSGRLPTPLIFRTARHNSLLRSDYSSND